MNDHRVTDDLSRALRSLGRLFSELADVREHELAKRTHVEAENARLHQSVERLHAENDEMRREVMRLRTELELTKR